MKGVNTQIHTMQTSRNLQLCSIILLFLSTFTTAWPWPQWLPELDTLIVRQNNDQSSTSKVPNNSHLHSKSDNIKTRHPQHQQQGKHQIPSSQLPRKLLFQPVRQLHYSIRRPLRRPMAAIKATKQQPQHLFTRPTINVSQPVECR